MELLKDKDLSFPKQIGLLKESKSKVWVKDDFPIYKL